MSLNGDEPRDHLDHGEKLVLEVRVLWIREEIKGVGDVDAG